MCGVVYFNTVPTIRVLPHLDSSLVSRADADTVGSEHCIEFQNLHGYSWFTLLQLCTWQVLKFNTMF